MDLPYQYPLTMVGNSWNFIVPVFMIRTRTNTVDTLSLRVLHGPNWLQLVGDVDRRGD